MLKRIDGRRAWALPLVLGITGCTGMGSLSDILAAGTGIGGTSGEIRGEIRQIDTSRREIEVLSGWGRSERVRYDGRTEVVYRQRRYDVRDLERGDLVAVRLDQDRDNRYARWVEVEQSARERQVSGPGNGIQRLDGTVARVDTQRGWFELQVGRGSPTLVTLPYQPNRSLQDRFRRLRQGERVRIEGEFLNPTRVELHRFL